MSTELKYVKIDKDFKDIDKIEEIYRSSFPHEERMFSLRQVLELKDKFKEVELFAIYDGDILVGLFAQKNYDEYKYLVYLAVNSKIRNKGYGGAIVKKIIEDNKDGIAFGFIEKPIPGEDNYEIKLRRQHFYERHGMIVVNYEKSFNGVKFIVVTNKTGEKFEKCLQKQIKEIDRMTEMGRNL